MHFIGMGQRMCPFWNANSTAGDISLQNETDERLEQILTNGPMQQHQVTTESKNAELACAYTQRIE